jgi:hypothetical protein
MRLKCENHNIIKSILPSASTKKCMSSHVLDEYSISHIHWGIGSKICFPNKSTKKIMLGHFVWEFVENTSVSKKIINYGIKLGNNVFNTSSSEYEGDSIINSMSDNIFLFRL